MHRTRPRRRRTAIALVTSTSVLAALVLLAGAGMETTAGPAPGSAVQTSRWGLLGYLEVVTVGPLGGPAISRDVRVDPRGMILTLLSLGATIAAAGAIARLTVRELRLPAHLCDECGYELGAAASPQCPECGTIATPADARPSRAALLALAASDAIGILFGVGVAALLLLGLWLPQLVMRGSMSGQPFREDFRNGWLAWRTMSRTWPDGADAAPVEVVALDPLRLAATVGLTLLGIGALVALGRHGRRRVRARLAAARPAESPPRGRSA